MPPENPEKKKLPRWRRLVKWGAILVVGGGVVGLLLLNLFFALPVGRNFVSKKVSGAVRMPVTVGSASYTPWGGLKLKELRIEQIEAARSVIDDPFFSAVSFEADVKLLTLLSDEVVIDRLVCDSPSISFVRRPEMVVRKPVAAAAPEGLKNDPDPDPDGAEAPARPEKPTTAPAPDAVVAEKVEPKRRRTVSVGEVEVRGGTVRVVSFEGKELIRIDGLRVVLDLSGGARRGELRFDDALLAGALKVSDFVSPVEIEGKRTTLTELVATCGGGEINGEIAIERQLGRMPFVAKLSASDIEVMQLVDGRGSGLESGKIGAELALSGTFQSPKTFQGGGRFWVESAVLDRGDEFEKLRSAMRVDADGSVELDPAEATFSIGSGVLVVRDASFGSGRLLLKSVGGVGMDGALNVATRIYLGADLYSAVRSKPVQGRGALQFFRLEGTDWYFRDELLTGTLRAPLLDFWRTGQPVAPGEVMRELSFDFESVQGGPIGR